MGDVNGDARDDIVIGQSGSLVLIELLPSGGFQTRLFLGAEGNCRGLALADVDNDGALDAIVSLDHNTSGLWMVHLNQQ